MCVIEISPGGGGAHIVRANSFQGYFPRRLSLDTVVPS